jgi:hypothetical protein
MKIHISPIHETEQIELPPERATLSKAHTLVDSPEEAEMILLVGSFGNDPHHLLDPPLYHFI